MNISTYMYMMLRDHQLSRSALPEEGVGGKGKVTYNKQSLIICCSDAMLRINEIRKPHMYTPSLKDEEEFVR